MEGVSIDKIDDIIHSKVRLGIMSILLTVSYAEFKIIRDKLNLTDGNLSTNMKKLEEAGYISVEKLFIDRKPVSRYSVTEKGKDAFKTYVQSLEKLLIKV